MPRARKSAGELVGARRRAGDDRQADQVRLELRGSTSSIPSSISVSSGSTSGGTSAASVVSVSGL